MNIFALSYDPEVAARLHCDKHVIKMQLESMQIMSTVWWIAAPRKANHLYDHGVIYKKTHHNHPCTLWAAQSRANFFWLLKLTHHLTEEKLVRWPHNAPFSNASKLSMMHAPCELPEGPFTPFAQTMPDEFKDDDPIRAYRKYYQHKYETMDCRWTNRDIPRFITQ